MPVVPGAGGNPYPTVGSVMNVARARVNDMMNDANGDLLPNDAPYAQTYLSAAWRWYQDKCSTVGVETLIRVAVLEGIPARASNDAADESWVTWAGCSDGEGQFDSPALPQDLIQPLSIWRRMSGNLDFLASPMTQATDGLPVLMDTHVFDWRDDGMYFFGEQYAQDFKLRYSAYRADLNVLLPDSLVPMMRCEDCLGARVAFEFASARGAAQAPAMEAWAEKAFAEGAGSRTNRRKQRQNIRRVGYSGRNFDRF